MSKKKIKLEVGKFYPVRDGSKKGHPGFLFNKESDLYDSVVTGTSKTKHHVEIHPTDSRVQKSYINKRPFRGTRNDYGNKEYPDMKFDEYSMNKAKGVMKRKPILGTHYKRKIKKGQGPSE